MEPNHIYVRGLWPAVMQLIYCMDVKNIKFEAIYRHLFVLHIHVTTYFNI